MLDAALPWKDLVTIGAATLVAVLGIMNTWNSISQRRLHLRIKPVFTNEVARGAAGFAIEVVNLSAFAVTIEEVGLTLKGADRGRKYAINPLCLDRGAWPRRLQPRESVTVSFNQRDAIHARAKINKAYARTSCGKYAYGSSAALAQLRAECAA